MNLKRWMAILAVVVLLIISLSFRMVTSFASFAQSSSVEDSFFNELTFKEQIMIDGKRSSQIAVINVNGVIQGGESGGLFAQPGYNQQELLDMIYYAGNEHRVKAILLEIDSPGGAVFETAQVHRALLEVQELTDKPIYVSMASMAASGGYYIAAPADKIYAESTTLTGSIGVIMENINFTKLAENHGIEFNTIKSGKHKDIMSPTKEMPAEEEAILQSIIDEMYDDFVDVIVDGRGLSDQRVREIADGRIYTGSQAKEVGLVDEVGSFDDALFDLMDMYNLEDSQVITYSTKDAFYSLFGVQLPNVFQTKNYELEKIMSLLEQSDKPRAMYLY